MCVCVLWQNWFSVPGSISRTVLPPPNAHCHFGWLAGVIRKIARPATQSVWQHNILLLMASPPPTLPSPARSCPPMLIFSPSRYCPTSRDLPIQGSAGQEQDCITSWAGQVRTGFYNHHPPPPCPEPLVIVVFTSTSHLGYCIQR